VRACVPLCVCVCVCAVDVSIWCEPCYDVTTLKMRITDLLHTVRTLGSAVAIDNRVELDGQKRMRLARTHHIELDRDRLGQWK